MSKILDIALCSFSPLKKTVINRSGITFFRKPRRAHNTTKHVCPVRQACFYIVWKRILSFSEGVRGNPLYKEGFPDKHFPKKIINALVSFLGRWGSALKALSRES